MIIDFLKKILIFKHGSLKKSRYIEKEEEINARCPICGDSKRDSKKARFYYNKKKDSFYCHNCGAKGYISLLVYKFPSLNGVDYKKLNTYINDKLIYDFITDNNNLNLTDNKEVKKVDIEFPQGSLVSYLTEDLNWKYLEPYEKARFLKVIQYLHDRKIDKNWYKYFYFTFERSKFDDYVFTLTKYQNQFVWSARSVLEGSNQRYLHMPDLKWSNLLGFSNEISNLKGKELYVVEGWFDALILNIEGYNAVSVFGLQNMKYDHPPLKILKDKYNVIWVPDNDKSLNQFAHINRMYSNIMKIKLLPKGLDVNDFKIKNEYDFRQKFDLIPNINLVNYNITSLIEEIM